MDRLFINLKVLSKIQENQKLSSYQDELIIENDVNFLNSFVRWIYNDSRNRTLYRIQEIIRESVKCGDNAIKSIELNNNNKYDRNLSEEELREQLETREWEKKRDLELRMDNNEVLSRLIEEMTDSINGIKNLKKTYIEDVTLCSRFEIEIEMLERGIKKFEEYISNLNN